MSSVLRRALPLFSVPEIALFLSRPPLNLVTPPSKVYLGIFVIFVLIWERLALLVAYLVRAAVNDEATPSACPRR